MIAELAVAIIILATVIFVYLKSNAIETFTILICAIISSTIALSFFETVANLVLGYGFGGMWAVGGCFLLLFVLSFAILNTIGTQLCPVGLHLGDIGDKAIRVVMGIVAGLIFAGVVLITAALMPLGNNWPYARYNTENKNAKPDMPDKVLILNADGFTSSVASIISKGAMSSKKSLAVFHPDFINELHLNRISDNENNLPVAGKQTVSVKSAWLSDKEFISAKDNLPLSQPSGTNAVIIRVALSGQVIKEGGCVTEGGSVVFTFAQVRATCKAKDNQNGLKGSGVDIYPTGFIKSGNTVETADLLEEISVSRAEFKGGKKEYDFLFFVPKDKKPILFKFKLNSADEIRKISSEDTTKEINTQPVEAAEHQSPSDGQDIH